MPSRHERNGLLGCDGAAKRIATYLHAIYTIFFSRSLRVLLKILRVSLNRSTTHMPNNNLHFERHFGHFTLFAHVSFVFSTLFQLYLI